MNGGSVPLVESPYRVAARPKEGPGTHLASLVYAGQLQDTSHAVVRRLEIDPADGGGWVLWQHTFPPAISIHARRHGRIQNLVLVPKRGGGILALDIYTGKPRWHVDHDGPPVEEMVRLSNGELLAWFEGSVWLEVDVSSGCVTDSGQTGRTLRGELALGGQRALDGGVSASAKVVIDGRTVALGRGLELEGWAALGEASLLRTGADTVLALVHRPESNEQAVACVAFDVGTLDSTSLTVLGRFPGAADVRSFQLVDGVALVRLGEGDFQFIIHPCGHLLATVRAGVVETHHDGKPFWRGIL